MNNSNPQERQKQTPLDMQTGSAGLTRYRSAPSSYFSALLNSPTGDCSFGADDFAQLFNPRASSPETQRIFSSFMNSSSADAVDENEHSYANTTPSQRLPAPKHEQESDQPRRRLQRQQSSDYSTAASQMNMYQSQNSDEKEWGGSFAGQIKMEAAGGGGGGLIRHSSSPAGLFANINIESEFGGMRSSGNGIRNYVGGGNNANAEASSFNRFNSQVDFSSKHYASCSSTRMMDTISEIGAKSDAPSDHNFDELRGNEDTYIADYINSWDDSSLLSDNFLEGLTDNKRSKRFSSSSASDDQSNESRNRPVTMLSHHLSLPKSTSAELSMEKLMQDTVPCKIRAKRGCATHPRSIAERVRRTKISERIRKLQELVPNMEKQTSTSDMLDLAVDYIKDLQRQVKTLSDNRDQCSCGATQTP